MIGCDFDPAELPRWQRLAKHLREKQLLKIRKGCEKQWNRTRFPEASPFIGAGIGRFLVRSLAESMERPYLDFSALFPAMINENGMAPADCAPAVAVAFLAGKN